MVSIAASNAMEWELAFAGMFEGELEIPTRLVRSGGDFRSPPVFFEERVWGVIVLLSPFRGEDLESRSGKRD